MEVSNQEHRIMILVVSTCHRKHNTCYTADRKDRNKCQGVQHRGCKFDLTLSQRKEPVKDLNPCRYSDRHRGDREHTVNHYTMTHCIEVMRPYDKGQERDNDHTVNHRFVAV
ncbi:hypothetical protein D3C81_1096980 [compost metagenome]